MVFLTETVSWYDAAINWHRKPPNYSSILDIILAKYDQLSPPYKNEAGGSRFWLHKVSVLTK